MIKLSDCTKSNFKVARACKFNSASLWVLLCSLVTWLHAVSQIPCNIRYLPAKLVTYKNFLVCNKMPESIRVLENYIFYYITNSIFHALCGKWNLSLLCSSYMLFIHAVVQHDSLLKIILGLKKVSKLQRGNKLYEGGEVSKDILQ